MMTKIAVAAVFTVVLVGVLAGASATDKSSPAVAPAQENVVVCKVGAVEMPYSGDGMVEYDSRENTWIIAFAAPAGWKCSNVGWAFPAGEYVPVTLEKDESWVVSGVVDAHVAEDVLFLSVRTDDGIHDFEFAYDAKLAVETLTYVQSDVTGELEVVGENLGQAAQAQKYFQEEEQAEQVGLDMVQCPGGWCKCNGKCEACCSEGFHPVCHCEGAGNCNCYGNKKTQLVLALESYDYTTAE